MTTNRTALRRPQRGHLNFDQYQNLWLDCPSDAFADDEQRCEAWTLHRERLMAFFGVHGRRPSAWWAYESPLPYPGYDLERSTLYENDLLAPEEKAELVTGWREEFEKCHSPDYIGYCEGPGRWLHGREATLAHLAWADVPGSLLKQWRTESKVAAV